MQNNGFIVAIQTCNQHVRATCVLLDLLWNIYERNPWPLDVELWIVYNQNCTDYDIEEFTGKIRGWRRRAVICRIIGSHIVGDGWPTGPNNCWITTLTEAKNYISPTDRVGVFCVEPDCLPLSLNWLHDIKNEWESVTNKYVMGHLEFENGAHYNGNAVYDARLFSLYPQCATPNGAFDYYNATTFLAIGINTNQITQDYHFGLDMRAMTDEYYLNIEKSGFRPVWFHGSKTISGVAIARKYLLKDAVLFIRTWHNDLSWLKVCLRSVKRYWNSSKGTIIVATPECAGHFKLADFPSLLDDVKAEVFYEPQLSDSRRGACFIGLTMDKYTDEKLICNIDSDCLFITPVYTTDFTTARGQPIIWMDSFEHLHSIRPNDAWAWAGYQNVVHDVLGIVTDYEFMQRHPFLYYTNSIRECRLQIEKHCNLPLMSVMERYASHLFSEFNCIGAFEHNRRTEGKYFFMMKDQGIDKLKQFHSWSMTPEGCKYEINNILGIYE